MDMVGEFMIENIRSFLEVSKDQKICKRKPTHGPCCTCQDCGYDLDACWCWDNKKLEVCEYVEKLQAENATLKESCKYHVDINGQRLDCIKLIETENAKLKADLEYEALQFLYGVV